MKYLLIYTIIISSVVYEVYGCFGWLLSLWAFTRCCRSREEMTNNRNENKNANIVTQELITKVEKARQELEQQKIVNENLNIKFESQQKEKELKEEKERLREEKENEEKAAKKYNALIKIEENRMRKIIDKETQLLKNRWNNLQITILKNHIKEIESFHKHHNHVIDFQKHIILIQKLPMICQNLITIEDASLSSYIYSWNYQTCNICCVN